MYERMRDGLNGVYHAYQDVFRRFLAEGKPVGCEEFDARCGELESNLVDLNNELSGKEKELREAARDIAGWSLPDHLGPQWRGVSPFREGGTPNRLVYGCRGQFNPFPAIDVPADNPLETLSLWWPVKPTRHTENHSVLNPDPDETREDTVRVRRKLPFAVDLTVPGGCPLELVESEGRQTGVTAFRLQLGPCDSAFLYCGRTK